MNPAAPVTKIFNERLLTRCNALRRSSPTSIADTLRAGRVLLIEAGHGADVGEEYPEAEAASVAGAETQVIILNHEPTALHVVAQGPRRFQELVLDAVVRHAPVEGDLVGNQ